MKQHLHRASSLLSTFTLALCVSASLVGCKGGGDGGATSSPATTTPSTPTAPPPAATNKVPTISGAALASVTVNTPYSFTPAATDADGDTLTFQIQNKPAWATFSTVNGQLSGTPTSASAHSNIVISASDGKASASLPAFSITVNATPAQTGPATLSWSAPTQNTDGSVLTDLAGFVISYGPSSTTLTQSVRITNASVDSYVFQQLPAGTYYFSVKAFTATGTESAQSSVVSKVIG